METFYNDCIVHDVNECVILKNYLKIWRFKGVRGFVIWRFKGVKGNNKTKVARVLFLFLTSFFKFSNIVCPVQCQKSHSFYMKMF